MHFLIKFSLILEVWGLILEGLGHHFGRILGVWGVPGTPWATKGHPRAIRIDFFSILGSLGDFILGSFFVSWIILGLSWSLLGLSWRLLDVSWSPSGPML